MANGYSAGFPGLAGQTGGEGTGGTWSPGMPSRGPGPSAPSTGYPGFNIKGGGLPSPGWNYPNTTAAWRAWLALKAPQGGEDAIGILRDSGLSTTQIQDILGIMPKPKAPEALPGITGEELGGKPTIKWGKEEERPVTPADWTTMFDILKAGKSPILGEEAEMATEKSDLRFQQYYPTLETIGEILKLQGKEVLQVIEDWAGARAEAHGEQWYGYLVEGLREKDPNKAAEIYKDYNEIRNELERGSKVVPITIVYYTPEGRGKLHYVLAQRDNITKEIMLLHDIEYIPGGRATGTIFARLPRSEQEELERLQRQKEAQARPQRRAIQWRPAQQW